MASEKPSWFYIILVLNVLVHRIAPQKLYYYSTYNIPWRDATAECELIGGYPVIVNDVAEAKYLKSYRTTTVLGIIFVMGLTDEAVERQFMWLDGTQPKQDVLSMMWYPNEPDYGTNHDCMLWNYDSVSLQGWHDFPCSYNLGKAFCEVDTGSAVAQAKADVRSCWLANELIKPYAETPEGSNSCPLSNKVYYSPTHRNNHKTWDQANAFCSLAKVTSQHEEHILNRFKLMMKLKKGFNTMWIKDEADETICLSTTGIKTCSEMYPILCEADIKPSEEQCYWLLRNIASISIETYIAKCQENGGMPAKFNNALEYQHALHYIRQNTLESSYLRIGGEDYDGDCEFHWYDGSILAWSLWLNGNPSCVQQVIMVHRPDDKFNDIEPHKTSTALCIKTIARTAVREVTQTGDDVDVTCSNFKTTRYTCGEVPPSPCSVDAWTLLEPWLSRLNSSVLQDSTTSTCIQTTNNIQVLTLANGNVYRGTFYVQLDLPTNVNMKLRVMISPDLSFPQSTCQLSKVKKCKVVSGTRYSCTCGAPCRLYVKVYKTEQTMVPLSVCEITIEL